MWDFEGPMRAFIVLVVLVIAMTGCADRKGEDR
jgi:hypothetical protein